MGDIRYNKSIVKNINESLIRRSLQGIGPFTKTKVARETGLSFPTVSRILDEMAESGEILGGGVDPTTGGRHAQSYVLNPEYAYVLCIYFPREKTMRALLMNAVGELVEREEVEIENIPTAVRETLDETIRRKMEKYPLKAVSVALPCGVSQGKLLFGAKGTSLEGYGLEEHLKKTFGIGARVENDMNTAATGCYVRMFGRDERISLACISVGSVGCGCGLYVRGHLVRGAHGFAGELRYVAADKDVNIDQAFREGFTAYDRTVCVAQMVSAVCSTVDPACVVFYERSDTKTDLPAVEEACRRFLPEEVVPHLIMTGAYVDDLEKGLTEFGTELLLSGYEIVNR